MVPAEDGLALGVIVDPSTMVVGEIARWGHVGKHQWWVPLQIISRPRVSSTIDLGIIKRSRAGLDHGTRVWVEGMNCRGWCVGNGRS